MQKLEIRFGIYGGLAVCAFKIIEFLPVFQKTRIESGIDTGLFALVIAAAAIIWGIKTKRSVHETNSITFTKAFITGIIIGALITVITIPFIYVYGKFIHPKEADRMIEYITINRGDYTPPSPELIREYYAPGRRSMQTGKDLSLTGFLVSLFSAIMFRRLPTTKKDIIKDTVLPSKMRNFFTFCMLFSQLPVIVYISLILKWTKISTFLFELLTDPLIDPDTMQEGSAMLALQGGTALISLSAVILNVVCYNKIAQFSHPLNTWNIRMILVNSLLFLISLWPVLHSLY